MRLITKAGPWLIIFLAALLAGMMCGCKTPQKAIDYLKKKDALADACAAAYPVKDSTVYLPGDTITKERFIKGDSILVSDTVTIKGETVYVSKKAKCPDQLVRDRFVHDTTVVWKENTARIAALTKTHAAEIAAVTKQLADKTIESDKWKRKAHMWWIFMIIGSVLTFGGILLFKSLK